MSIQTSQDRAPLFDLTSMLAVESLFRNGPKDPWLFSIVSNMTDLFIFSDHARVVVPSHSNMATGGEEDSTFGALNLLRRRDPQFIKSTIYRTDEQIGLNAEYMDVCFAAFSKWARNNRQQMRRWLRFHRQPWIRGTHRLRFGTNYLYPTQTLMNTPEFDSLTKTLGIAPEEVCYTFDLVLRYSLLGEIAGEDQHYLAHPIREELNWPTMQREEGLPPPVPVHIGRSIMPIVHQFTMDEYTAFLHEARGIVCDMGIADMKPRTIERDTLRELAIRLWLPPKLRAWEKAYGILSGLICGAATYPALGPLAAGLGAGVSITASLWTGTLPRTATRIRWLRWALEWDIEQEARPDH